MLDRQGNCKVIVCAAEQFRPRLTRYWILAGTRCAAPELESPYPADPRADVYSIAVMLYLLVTGVSPVHLFMADDRDYETVPGPLAKVIRKGAEYCPGRRYQTAAELAVALRKVFDALPPDPPDAPALVRPDLAPLTIPIRCGAVQPLAAKVLRSRGRAAEGVLTHTSSASDAGEPEVARAGARCIGVHAGLCRAAHAVTALASGATPG